MHSFKDAEGRAWDVEVTPYTLGNVRDLLGIDVARMATARELFGMIADDPITLVNVLYVLCRDQAEERDISDRDFGRLLLGDVIDRATEAFVQGVVDFFPSRQRRLLRAALAKLEKARETALAKSEVEIEKLNPDPSSSATSSEGSSESTPDD